MKVESFVECLEADFFTGVPDSQLKALCDYLMNKYGISKKHIIAANEGNSVALAAGYYLSTGKTPVVYLQNSGIGNIVNPVTSLLNKEIYGIPCIFVIGWRGEPGVYDEPQHIYQGEITNTLLTDIGIHSYVISEDTTQEKIQNQTDIFRNFLKKGESVAFVIKKGALTYSQKVKYKNRYSMRREDVIRKITQSAADDLIVSTTGKTSRELFEIREKAGQTHKNDFLTVGSMGHCSSIALGIAMNREERRVWCIDGDGALLMHMGSMAIIGSQKPQNLIHVVLNNGSHESVGGMPTAAEDIDLKKIAEGCGYLYTESVSESTQLNSVLEEIKEVKGPVFIEIKCGIGSRSDLGRPTTLPRENKKNFMQG